MPSFPVRVYYEDTDAGGVVYYANYLKFAERARTEALRQTGLEQRTLLEEQDTAFVVRRCEVDFLKPARLDDALTVWTEVEEIGKASLTMRQEIRRGEELLVVVNVKIAVVNGAMKLVRLADELREVLKKLE